MIQVAVQYPRTEGTKFDMDYYCSKHMPMVQERCGDALKNMIVVEGMSGGMSGQPSANVAFPYIGFGRSSVRTSEHTDMPSVLHALRCCARGRARSGV